MGVETLEDAIVNVEAEGAKPQAIARRFARRFPTALAVILSAAKDLAGSGRTVHPTQILQSLSLHQDDIGAT